MRLCLQGWRMGAGARFRVRAEAPGVSPSPAAVDADRQRRRLAPRRTSPSTDVAKKSDPVIAVPALADHVQKRVALALATGGIGLLASCVSAGLVKHFWPHDSWLVIAEALQTAWAVGLPISLIVVCLRSRVFARRWPISAARETFEALKQDPDWRVRAVATGALRGLPEEGYEAVPAMPPIGAGTEVSAANSGGGPGRIEPPRQRT